MPQLATDLDLILFDNKTGGEAALPIERWEKVRKLKRFLKVGDQQCYQDLLVCQTTGLHFEITIFPEERFLFCLHFYESPQNIFVSGW